MVGAAPRDISPEAVVDTDRPWQWRSGYVEQVRQISAPRLEGRSDELAELAAFCASDEQYVWWQGGPWSGKTALMAAFVLNPPPGVDVVSFFVTRRYAAQSDSVAYVEMLIDQLSALLDQAPPAVLPRTARHAVYLRLLAEAAERAAVKGRQLVLLVDGLDEDAHSTGFEVPSIASMLPRSPAAGLQVVVTSRLEMRVPTDVAPDHPLRSCRIRPLVQSKYVRRIQEAARQELNGLLHAGKADTDIVGLLVAAGGGLTQADLAELTGAPLHELAALLTGRFGRTLSSRDGVLLFAHEELRTTAARSLGPAATDALRRHIH
jgi:hypothetical protein